MFAYLFWVMTSFFHFLWIGAFLYFVSVLLGRVFVHTTKALYQWNLCSFLFLLLLVPICFCFAITHTAVDDLERGDRDETAEKRSGNVLA